ncbi:MAG TPA: hypothetical protein VJJ22_00450 [Candidatus Paceibacterota bacterium]
MSPALSYFILFVIVVPFLAYFYRRYKASTAYSWQQQPADPEYAGKIRGGLLEEAEQEVPFEGYLNSHKLPEPPQERARGPSPLPPPKKVVQLTARQPPQGGEWVSKKELENAIFSVKMDMGFQLDHLKRIIYGELNAFGDEIHGMERQLSELADMLRQSEQRRVKEREQLLASMAQSVAPEAPNAEEKAVPNVEVPQGAEEEVMRVETRETTLAKEIEALKQSLAEKRGNIASKSSLVVQLGKKVTEANETIASALAQKAKIEEQIGKTTEVISKEQLTIESDELDLIALKEELATAVAKRIYHERVEREVAIFKIHLLEQDPDVGNAVLDDLKDALHEEKTPHAPEQVAIQEATPPPVATAAPPPAPEPKAPLSKDPDLAKALAAAKKASEERGGTSTLDASAIHMKEKAEKAARDAEASAKATPADQAPDDGKVRKFPTPEPAATSESTPDTSMEGGVANEAEDAGPDGHKIIEAAR